MFTRCTGDGKVASDEGAGGASTSAAALQHGAFLLLFLVFFVPASAVDPADADGHCSLCCCYCTSIVFI